MGWAEAVLSRVLRGVRTAGTAPMLFICTGWFIGDAARGPSGAWGICTFPMDMGLN